MGVNFFFYHFLLLHHGLLFPPPETDWNSQCIDRIRAIPVGGESNNCNIINNHNNIIVPIQSQNQNIRKIGRPKGSLNKKTITRNSATSQNHIINLSAHNNKNETAHNV